MIAKFENQTFHGDSRISAHKYENLLNLPHWHVEYELIFCDSGEAAVITGDEQYHLQKGMCIFVDSGEVHNIRPLTENIVSVIKIDRRLADAAFEGKTPKYPLIHTDLPLADIFGELVEEMADEQPYSELICNCTLLRLLGHLFRNCEMHSKQAVGSSEKYKELLKQIEARYADITFEEAAAFMCYSKPYFSKYFSRITGMTFSRYVNIIRISEAVSLISERKLGMTEIAHTIGFGSIRHFNRVFKELTGYAPTCLPNDYVFIQYKGNQTTQGFDPTLSSPAIL